MDFFSENSTAIVSIVLATKMLASAITSMTNTPKDDKIVAKVYRMVELLAGIWTNKAKM